MTTKKIYAERHNKEKMLLLSLCFGLLLTLMSLNVKANEYLLPQSDSVYLTDVDIKNNGDGVSGIFSVPGGCQNILILLENLKKDRMYLVEM